MRMRILIALLAGLAASPLQAKPVGEHLYGPVPDWEHYRDLAETAVRARLLDPQSAQFTWLGSYFKGQYKGFLLGRTEGYVACGTVNAKNRMGGYTGPSTFVVVVDYDRVLQIDLDPGQSGFAAEQCAAARSKGLLPPLPASDAVPKLVSRTASSAATGLSLRTMPEGAYVTAVAPGSAAEAAGLKPGMVIASVNAIPLAGMGDAMLAVVDAAGAGGGATMTIIGGATIKLGAKP